MGKLTENNKLKHSMEFKARRKRFMDMMGNECIAILPTAQTYLRNNDVHFPFRPDSDFYYLTSYPEPEAVTAIIPNRQQGEYILFCRERDPLAESWDGQRAGIEGACDFYGADEAFPIDKMGDILPNLIEGNERIFYNVGKDTAFDQRVMGWVNRIRNKSRAGIRAPGEFISPAHILHDMRLYKSRQEINTMRTAAKISATAHKHAMQACHAGLTEYQIEAELIYQFIRQGGRTHAYPPIVGSGANSCILHYTDNNEVLQDGDVLLIDAGAEYNYYASDITRTFPVNGKFSQAQKDIYQLVLAAQLAAIDKIMPGKHWNDPHQSAVEVITRGLVDLGLLKGDINTLIDKHAYGKYYMHNTGHWLGMDVHDVGDYKIDGDWRMLEPGMVMTVEPGVYLPATLTQLPKEWRNIGIRIEDDVLVTKDGCEVLSKDVPKTVEEIESLMAG